MNAVWRFAWPAAIGLVATLSAIGIVHVKYLTRAEFATIQEIRNQRDALDVEWSRLRLEEASLATHPYIEDRARRLLDMRLPRADEVRMLLVSGHD